VIFRRYAELGSVSLLWAELDRLGIVSKRREGAGGRLAGGQHFSRGALYLMLQNRLYRGFAVECRLIRRRRARALPAADVAEGDVLLGENWFCLIKVGGCSRVFPISQLIQIFRPPA
jgi:hypothetical protein